MSENPLKYTDDCASDTLIAVYFVARFIGTVPAYLNVQDSKS